MKNKKIIYVSLMVISLIGIGIGAYFLTKKKGLVMQSESPEDENHLISEDVQPIDNNELVEQEEIHPIDELRPITERPIILPIIKPFIQPKKHYPIRQFDVEMVRDLNDSRVYTHLEHEV